MYHIIRQSFCDDFIVYKTVLKGKENLFLYLRYVLNKEDYFANK